MICAAALTGDFTYMCKFTGGEETEGIQVLFFTNTVQCAVKCLRVGKKALLGFEPRISCLLDRRFNQLSHGACCTAETITRNKQTKTTTKEVKHCKIH